MIALLTAGQSLRLTSDGKADLPLARDIWCKAPMTQLASNATSRNISAKFFHQIRASRSTIPRSSNALFDKRCLEYRL